MFVSMCLGLNEDSGIPTGNRAFPYRQTAAPHHTCVPGNSSRNSSRQTGILMLISGVCTEVFPRDEKRERRMEEGNGRGGRGSGRLGERDGGQEDR